MANWKIKPLGQNDHFMEADKENVVKHLLNPDRADFHLTTPACLLMKAINQSGVQVEDDVSNLQPAVLAEARSKFEEELEVNLGVCYSLVHNPFLQHRVDSHLLEKFDELEKGVNQIFASVGGGLDFAFDHPIPPQVREMLEAAQVSLKNTGNHATRLSMMASYLMDGYKDGEDNPMNVDKKDLNLELIKSGLSLPRAESLETQLKKAIQIWKRKHDAATESAIQVRYGKDVESAEELLFELLWKYPSLYKPEDFPRNKHAGRGTLFAYSMAVARLAAKINTMIADLLKV